MSTALAYQQQPPRLVALGGENMNCHLQTTIAQQPPVVFTCLSCHVTFPAAAAQRDHYRTDWHRYNLKRKVADLLPVTADAFAEKVAAQNAKNRDAEQSAGVGVECAECKKTYSTENSYNNHLQSKRHRDAVARAAAAAANPCAGGEPAASTSSRGNAPQRDRTREEPLRITEDMTEAEVDAAVDRKISSAPRLQPEDCLFCPLRSASFEENMEHMTLEHSLFIPDVEYISDLRGLVRHLGEKISVTNLCLLCNGRGRTFHSLDAVRGHMVDKSHCKIAYDTEEEQLEIGQFYDFSASYPVAADGISTEDDVEELHVKGHINFAEDETQLVLPSGVRLGHRSLQRYYKQHFRPEESRDSVVINRLLTHYSESNNQLLARMSGGRKTALVAAAKRSGMAGRVADIVSEQRAQRSRQVDFVTRIGFKGNQQKHFRDELLQ